MGVAWYRKVLRARPRPGRRLFLRFGAVDYRAEVFVNGVRVLEHEGGHTPFGLDLTPFLGRPMEVLVRAEDDPLDPEAPRGKQALGSPGASSTPAPPGSGNRSGWSGCRKATSPPCASPRTSRPWAFTSRSRPGARGRRWRWPSSPG
ncbi:beta-galactosidase [Thermus thermophilus]|nr:beta-galactosidase [Thermus thermophilus]